MLSMLSVRIGRESRKKQQKQQLKRTIDVNETIIIMIPSLHHIILHACSKYREINSSATCRLTYTSFWVLLCIVPDRCDVLPHAVNRRYIYRMTSFPRRNKNLILFACQLTLYRIRSLCIFFAGIFHHRKHLSKLLVDGSMPYAVHDEPNEFISRACK